MRHQWELQDYDRGHLTPGLRNSTHCPVRRVLEQYPETKDRYHPFKDGVSTLGHVLAQHFIMRHLLDVRSEEAALSVMLGENPRPLTTEYAIDFDLGITHLDAVVWRGEHKGTWEIKTYGDAWGLKPKDEPLRENIMQVQRQRYLAIEYKHDLPEPWVIQKIGKNRGRLPEPFPVSYNQEDHARISGEFNAVQRLLSYTEEHGALGVDGEAVQALDLSCLCGQCFPKPVKEMPQTASALVDELKYMEPELKEQESTRKTAAAEKKRLKAEVDERNERLKAIIVNLGDENAYEDDQVRITLTKSGAMRKAWKKNEGDSDGESDGAVGAVIGAGRESEVGAS